MTDPERIVSYEDVVSYKDNPEVLLIDVRDPQELKDTGIITASINIPLGTLSETLQNSTQEDFKAKFGRDLPNKDSQLVFSCKMGGRATKAMENALQLGYENAKVYKGSWLDWSSKQN